EAIPAYEQVRTAGGPFAWHATRKLALMYYLSNDLDKAEEEYRAALAQNPQDVEAYCKLGDICNRRGWWGISEQHFGRALILNPNHVYARTGLAQALAQQGQYVA